MRPEGGQYDRNGGQHLRNIQWERFIFKQLQKKQKQGKYTISYQNSKKFWNKKLIRPDLILEKDGETYVIDTKWKILSSLKPADDDLKQMFVYNLYWEASKSILLYPDIYGLETNYGKFRKSNFISYNSDQATLMDHYCKLCFIKIWERANDQPRINQNISEDIIQQL